MSISFPRPGSLLVVVEVEKAFSLCFCRHAFVFSSNDFVFSSRRMKDLYHLLRVFVNFSIFSRFPFFFRQGGLFIFHLVQCMTEEMTIEDAHKLISEDYFFTGLIIVIGES